MKISFVRTAKPRGFHYKPMHYDAKKEAEEKRRKEIEMNIKHPERLNLRKEMERKWRRKDLGRKKARRITFLVYVVLLLLCIYYIYLT